MVSERPRNASEEGDLNQDNRETTAVVDVAAAMTPDPEVVHVDHTLVEAAARMRDHDVGLMFVVDGDQLVGAITDRDICCRAVASAIDPGEATVLQAMTRHVVFCRRDDGIDAALRTMEHEDVRRLAVLNREDELVGVVSLSDVAHTHPRPGALGRSLRRIATPTAAEKKPRRGSPTGGRAVPSPAGVPEAYAVRPRLAPGSHVRGAVANGK